MWLATLQFETRLQKCIRMGITIFKISFGELYRLLYGRKSCFAASLARRRKTKFRTVYLMIYLRKQKFLYGYSLNFRQSGVQLSIKFQVLAKLYFEAIVRYRLAVIYIYTISMR